MRVGSYGRAISKTREKAKKEAIKTSVIEAMTICFFNLNFLFSSILLLIEILFIRS